MHNYMIADLVGTAGATLVFSILFLPPGFVLGWASNLLGFRGHSWSEKLLWSVVLSVAMTPILAVLVGRFLSVPAAIAAFLLLAGAAVALVARECRQGSSLSNTPRSTWIALAMMAAWAVVAMLSVIDLQFDHRLYVSVAVFDHSVRIPFVRAVARTGVPPLNPFNALGDKVPVLRYYYYWYVVCALPMRLAGLGARACFNASVVWSGLALAATIPLYLKRFFRETEALRRKSLIGICLLLVTGLDLIPYGALYLGGHIALGDLEQWNPSQVTSWMDSLIWVPHHVAALIACMTGLLVLSTLDEHAEIRERIWAAIIAGIAFASAAGLSLFVTFTFAVFAVLWTIILLLQRRIRDFATFLAAGGVSFLLSIPYILDLSTQSKVGHGFVFFALRAYMPTYAWLQQWVRSPILMDCAKLPIIVGVYFIELGFFFCVAVLRFRHELGSTPLTDQRRAAWVLFTTCLLIVTTMQSEASGNNDLGFRGILPVQFVLLLWAAPLVHDLFCRHRLAASSPRIGAVTKAVLAGTLLLGLLGTGFQLVLLRWYAPLVDAGGFQQTEGFLGKPQNVGRRTYLLRDGLAQLDKVTTPAFVLQYSVFSMNYFFLQLYATRQVAAAGEDCGTTFGGDFEKCQQARPYLRAAFQSPEHIRNWDMDRFCDAYHVNVLVATDADPVWRDRDSWVWSRKAVVANDSLRAIPCGTAGPSPAVSH